MTFRFHYRSWTNLRQLNLVPSTEIEAHVTPVHHQEVILPSREKAAERAFTFEVESLDGTIFEGGSQSPASGSGTRLRADPKTYALKRPPELLPVLGPKWRPPPPSETLHDTFSEESNLRAFLDPIAGLRRSSKDSHAPSITPSLLHYAEDDIYSDEVEIGVATRVELLAETPGGKRPLPTPPVAASPSDYDTSPPPSAFSLSPSRPSSKHAPHMYLVTTGSILERHLSMFSSPPAERERCGSELGVSNRELLRLGTLNLTESEWIKGTRSPAGR